MDDESNDLASAVRCNDISILQTNDDPSIIEMWLPGLFLVANNQDPFG